MTKTREELLAACDSVIDSNREGLVTNRPDLRDAAREVATALREILQEQQPQRSEQVQDFKWLIECVGSDGTTEWWMGYRINFTKVAANAAMWATKALAEGALKQLTYTEEGRGVYLSPFHKSVVTEHGFISTTTPPSKEQAQGAGVGCKYTSGVCHRGACERRLECQAIYAICKEKVLAPAQPTKGGE